MSSEDSDNDTDRPLRSLVCEKFALITFQKRTARKIDVFWLNYEGVRVKYTVMTGEAGQEWPILTYETHPWIFRDAETGDVIVADNGQRVFYPVAWGGEERQSYVSLDIPVYTLRERCLQMVRKIKTHVEIEDLYLAMEIPLVLKQDLMHREHVPYNERLTVPAV